MVMVVVMVMVMVMGSPQYLPASLAAPSRRRVEKRTEESNQLIYVVFCPAP